MTAFTVMAWVKLSVDRNAFSCVFAFGASSGGDYNSLNAQSDGTTLEVYNSSTSTSGASLTAGTWVHLAWTGDATNLLAYVNGVLNITRAQDGTPPTNGKLWIGSNNDTEWFNGCFAAIKVYSATLTAAEIANEARQQLPIRTANLYAFMPSRNVGEQGVDYSGAGNTFTIGGTLATEDGPPVPWVNYQEDAVYIAAGGNTAFTKDLAGTIALSGASTKAVAAPKTGTATLTGSLARAVGKPLTGSATSSGALTRAAGKSLTGSCTSTGALTKAAAKPITGTAATSGALTKAAGKPLAGSTAASGTLTKAISKAFAGGVTLSGAFEAIKVILLALAGTITATGALTKAAAKSLADSITGSGTLTNACSKGLTGAASLAGSLANACSKGLTGSVAASGSLNRAVALALSGTLTLAGTITKAIAKGLVGAITLAGNFAHNGAGAISGLLWRRRREILK